MREIKFRGKRADNGKWVYGGFHKHQSITPSPVIPKGEKPPKVDYIYLIIESGSSDWEMPKLIVGQAVDPATVGQYVDLKDKNGREIYEGDIIKWYNSDVLLISRCKRHARFLIGDDLLTKGAALDSIIIGNIHDNPELLEVTK